MFCVRCGKETGDDSEYCIDCATEVVLDRVAEDEPVAAPEDSYITRCRSCRQEISSDHEICPHCGVNQVELPAR
jgi:RNA polymerase subunit RPABC4/transcription elongation factor Spt4